MLRGHYDDLRVYLNECGVRATYYAAGGVDEREISHALDVDRSIGLSLVKPLYEDVRRFPESDENSFPDYLRAAYNRLNRSKTGA